LTPLALPLTIDDILRAQATIAGAVLPTPCLPARRLSNLIGADIWVKYENLQVTNSFKERGAVNRLSALSADERRRGVIAMSAGNHAQALAYHAQRLGIPATIVMPETTPFVKVASTRAFGAQVVLFGETLAESQIRMEALRQEHALVLVHPYDDVLIAAGQGTIGLEMLDACPDLDTLVIPVGGGGLAAGIAVAAKSRKPDIRIIGVESELYPSLDAALKGEIAQCGGQTLAEGIAVKNVGALGVAVLGALMDQLILVSETDIERAVNAFLTLQKTMAEGAGAAGLAAMMREPHEFRGCKVGLVLCGGNIDPRIAASVMVRALEREEKIVAFRLQISDRPGELGTITSVLGTLGANILEVEHRRLFLDVPAKGASIDVTIETRDGDHAADIARELTKRGYTVTRIHAGEAGF
jgi:threonine dehydratase